MKQVVVSPAPGRQLRLGAQAWEIVAVDEDGQVSIRNLLSGTKAQSCAQDFVGMLSNGVLEFVDVPSISTRKVALSFETLDAAIRDRISRRVNYARRLAHCRGMGPRNPLLARQLADAARELGDAKPPSLHTAYRWLNRFAAAQYDVGALAPEAFVKRSRRSRLPPGARDALTRHLLAVLKRRPHQTIRNVADEVVARAALELELGSIKTLRGTIVPIDEVLPTDELVSASQSSSRGGTLSVSYETLRTLANSLDKKQLARAHWGRTVAQNQFGARIGKVEALVPLERVEIDNFLLDVHVVCPYTRARLGRPWLTAAVDCYSGLVVG